MNNGRVVEPHRAKDQLLSASHLEPHLQLPLTLFNGLPLHFAVFELSC